MMNILWDMGCLTFKCGEKRNENRVYDSAITKLLLDDILNIKKFMDSDRLGFRNHTRDKKGNLIRCEAYFIDNS